MDGIKKINDEAKLTALINFIDASIYEHINGAATFENVIATLRYIYTKPTKKVFARHRLTNCKLKLFQSLEKYLQCLKRVEASGVTSER